MFKLTIQDEFHTPVGQVTFEQGSYIIGRVEGCDVVLPSSSVSRKHAKLFVQHGRCYLEDLGSSNGVIADGQRVVGRRDLGSASQIRIGDYYLYLELLAAEMPHEQRLLQTVFIPKDSDHFKLVRIHDSFAGEEFILSETENTIGRTDENFILLSDRSISRHHAKIIRQGDLYTVFDMGSSNGSTLNGKPIRDPVVLQQSDQIMFGNVAFLFVPSGQHVDQSLYKKANSKNQFTKLALATILVLLGVLLGSIILYALVSLKKSTDPGPQTSFDSPLDRPAQDTLAQRVAALFAAADRAGSRNDWAQAQHNYQEILALAPKDAKAAEGLERVRIEKEAMALVQEGETLSETGKHEEAKVTLEKIPPGTKARERANQTLAHLDRTLAYKYKSQAETLMKRPTKRNLTRAYTLLSKAQALTPDDQGIHTHLQTLTDTMKKKRYPIPSPN